MALHFTDAEFEKDVLQSEIPVLVDFWAEWCGPCRMLGPIIDELAEQFEGKIKIGKVDIENNPNIAGQFGIRSIPTLLFIKNGEVVDKQVGAVPRKTIEEKLNNLL